MSSDPAFQIGQGQADSLLFRVAGLSAYVLAGADKTKVQITGLRFSASVGLLTDPEGFQLPRLEFSVAIGTPAEKEGRPSTAYKLFQRFTLVQVWVEVSEQQQAFPGLGPGMTAGRYLVFDGIVDSVSPARGVNSVELNVTCQHRLAKLLAASSLYSPYLPNSLQDVRVVYPGLYINDDRPDLPTESLTDLWQTLVRVLKIVLDPQGTDDSTPFQQTAAAQGLQSSNKRALNTLQNKEEIESLLQLTLDVSQIQNAVTTTAYEQALNSMGQRPNLWSLLVNYGRTYGFTFIPTARKMMVVPDQPFGKQADYKVAPAGSFMFLSSGDGQSQDFTMIVGTLILGDSVGSLTHEKGEEQALPSYFIPKERYSAAQDYAVALADRLPDWLLPKQVQTAQSEVVAPTSPASPGAAPTDGDTSTQPAGGQALPSVLYARMLTLAGFFGTTSAQIMTGLRFDVVPGQSLRLDFRTPDGQPYQLFGYVRSVSWDIDPARGTAGTRIDLAYIRSAEDQTQVVENGATDHYCWADRTRKVSELRWAAPETGG